MQQRRAGLGDFVNQLLEAPFGHRLRCAGWPPLHPIRSRRVLRREMRRHDLPHYIACRHAPRCGLVIDPRADFGRYSEAVFGILHCLRHLIRLPSPPSLQSGYSRSWLILPETAVSAVILRVCVIRTAFAVSASPLCLQGFCTSRSHPMMSDVSAGTTCAARQPASASPEVPVWGTNACAPDVAPGDHHACTPTSARYKSGDGITTGPKSEDANAELQTNRSQNRTEYESITAWFGNLRQRSAVDGHA